MAAPCLAEPGMMEVAPWTHRRLAGHDDFTEHAVLNIAIEFSHAAEVSSGHSLETTMPILHSRFLADCIGAPRSSSLGEPCARGFYFGYWFSH